MKNILRLTGFVLLTALSWAQESKRVPQGIREADKAEIAFEKNIPPPQNIPRAGPQNLQHDADELARLAQSIPTAIEQVHRGLFPSDLREKLKKIEKISKRLRSQLTP